MPSWWSKSTSKESKKKKTSKESLIDTLRKFRIPSDHKSTNKSGGARKGCSDTVSELGSFSRGQSRSASPFRESKHVARCQSFQERPQAQPLPLPRVISNEPAIIVSSQPKQEKGSKFSSFFPHPHTDYDGAESVFSECYSDSDAPPDSSQHSPLASDYDTGGRTTAGSPASMIFKDQSHKKNRSRDVPKPRDTLFNTHISSSPPGKKRLGNHVPNLQVHNHVAAFCSAPDSSISSPSRSPLRAFGTDFQLLSSGQCSSPGSGQNSGQNSMGGDMAGIFWQPSRGSPSPEYSPLPSPRMTSPGPSSRIHSGAVTPLHPRAGGAPIESLSSWPDDGKKQSHRLPLPPISVTTCSPFSQPNSAATSPSVPRSPGSKWKKGKLLGRGSFGHVYVGFNSESGEMCAMKEVTLFSDDAKSKESARQLGQEVSLLSRLSHPNIVRYYGSEMVSFILDSSILFCPDVYLEIPTFSSSYDAFIHLVNYLPIIARLDQVVITLASGGRGQGFDPHSLQGRRSFSTVGRTGSSLSTLGRGMAVDDKLYIYLEYVSGGSIYKLLQDYGQLGESAIRSYTRQILSGLAYLHAKNTVHRDIKGANILVDPNGRVKVADFGMAKHISAQTCPLSFKGSPYWMAPEIITNTIGSNLAVDIWSLGCTVLEMATTKPPWSQYEGVAALFKIGHSKELPSIPDHLSDEGKDFVRQCLQRNPLHRPTAAQLLNHCFVRNAASLERPVPCPEPSDPPLTITNGVKSPV
ncbi:mitogen-activated protein kinase kinase kinase YODA-like protein [Tanacetum coccineum]